MKFAIIEPAETSVRMADARMPWDLYAQIGLSLVDHGVILPWHATPIGIGVGIAVGEFSLYVPPEQQRYFTIGRHLYGGPAVLYAFDQLGETVDLHELPMVIFISLSGIEDAIARGQIDRPVMAVNNEQIWQWPGPAPFDLPKRP